jgi:O-antigen/teichoic acid export membrane protein
MRLLRAALAWLPRGTTGAVASRAANAALAFLATVVLARALGPSPYGEYALAISVLGLAAIAAQAGLDGLTPRSLGVYVHQGDWPHAFAFLRWTTRAVVAASVLAFAAANAVLSWDPMGWTEGQRLAARFILLGLPFVALLRLERARLQALDRTAEGLFYELPAWNSLVVLSGVLALLLPELRTSAAMAALYAGAFLAAWLGAHWAVRRRLPPRPGRLEPVRPDWLRSGAFFTALAALGFLLSQSGVLLVGTVLTAEETGRFSVAARSAALALVVLQPLQQVVAPRIARAWSAGDAAEAVRLARRAGQLSLLAALGMVGFFWLFGGAFLGLFGEAYGDALWALRWLSLGQLLAVAFGPGAVVLQMVHRERASLAVQATALALGLPLMAWATARAGIEGAALAQMAMAVGASAGCYAALRRQGLDVLPFRPAVSPRGP